MFVIKAWATIFWKYRRKKIKIRTFALIAVHTHIYTHVWKSVSRKIVWFSDRFEVISKIENHDEDGPEKISSLWKKKQKPCFKNYNATYLNNQKNQFYILGT